MQNRHTRNVPVSLLHRSLRRYPQELGLDLGRRQRRVGEEVRKLCRRLIRSNVPRLAEFSFDQIDPTYPTRAAQTRDTTGHIIVAGADYGQGSSREHAAITPRYLGLRVVLAVSFARIHWQNLANFGALARWRAGAPVHGCGRSRSHRAE